MAQDFPSADRTPEFLSKFASQIRILREPNGGQASAFNHGIPQCRGEIIAFLDGDDWWAPGKLHRVAELLAGDPSLRAVGHRIIKPFSDGAERTVAVGFAPRFRLDAVSSTELFRLDRCYLGASRLTLRSSVARKILPVSDSLVFEAVECSYTPPVLADAMILPDALTDYLNRGANLFISTGAIPEGGRRKQRVLAVLAVDLRRAFPLLCVLPGLARVVLEIVEGEAAHLHLKLDGGFPWETYRTETTVYRIQHPDAT